MKEDINMTAGEAAAAAAAAIHNASENCLPAGTRLADFEIVEVLGEGGFGIVYLAFDHALRRTVAIKEFMPAVLAMRGHDGAVTLRAERHHDTFQGGLKSFINEARLLAQFDHPALVKVHRYWEQNDTAYTAMQYYEGRTIKDIVVNSPALVDQAWCLAMLAQVLQALEVLYTMQIVHRDVSPDNIIVQDNGEAVLLDFGSAREIISDMTRAVTVILKPGYAPVEQYANDTSLEQGPYTDIYALCAVIYFVLTGKPPANAIARMVQDPLTPLATLAPPGYSAEFLSAIDHGMAVLPEHRPRTIAAFRALLGIPAVQAPVARATNNNSRRFATVAAREPAQAALAAPTPAPANATDPDFPPARRSLRWRLLAVAGVLAVVLGLGLALLPNSQQADASAPAPAAASTEPRRTVVSAQDVLGTEAENPPETMLTELAVSEQPVAPPSQTSAPTLAAAVQAQAPAAEAATEMVPLTLAIKPWGTLIIDGRERGVSPPMKRITLPAGSHKIQVVNPAYPAYTTTLTLKKNDAITVTHDFGAAPP